MTACPKIASHGIRIGPESIRGGVVRPTVDNTNGRRGAGLGTGEIYQAISKDCVRIHVRSPQNTLHAGAATCCTRTRDGIRHGH
eukprot:7167898-Prymnesium_polylepis.1